MPPRPRVLIARAAACERTRTDVHSTSSIASSASISLARNPFFMPYPALLTSRSTGRASSASRWATFPIWARSDRSATSTSDRIL